MSVVNSKKPASTNDSALWAASATRIRRGGSSRLGRRSALLGVLTSMYANSSRGTGSGASTGRTAASTDRA